MSTAEISAKFPVFTPRSHDYTYEQYVPLVKNFMKKAEENPLNGFRAGQKVFTEFVYSNEKKREYKETIVLNAAAALSFKEPEGTVYVKPYATIYELEDYQEEIKQAFLNIDKKIQEVSENQSGSGGGSDLTDQQIKDIIESSFQDLKARLAEGSIFLTHDDLPIIGAMFTAALKSFEFDYTPANEYSDTKLSEYKKALGEVFTQTIDTINKNISLHQDSIEKNYVSSQKFSQFSQDVIQSQSNQQESLNALDKKIEEHKPDYAPVYEKIESVQVSIAETYATQSQMQGIQSDLKDISDNVLKVAENSDKTDAGHAILFDNLNIAVSSLARSSGANSEHLQAFVKNTSILAEGIKENLENHRTQQIAIDELVERVSRIEQDIEKNQIQAAQMNNEALQGIEDIKQLLTQNNTSVADTVKTTSLAVANKIDNLPSKNDIKNIVSDNIEIITQNFIEKSQEIKITLPEQETQDMNVIITDDQLDKVVLNIDALLKENIISYNKTAEKNIIENLSEMGIDPEGNLIFNDQIIAANILKISNQVENIESGFNNISANISDGGGGNFDLGTLKDDGTIEVN